MHVYEALHQPGQHEAAGRGVAQIQVHGPDQRLQRVAVHRARAGHAALRHVELHELVEPQLQRYPVQALAVDDARAHLRQKALLLVGVLAKQVLGHHRAQHRVAEKLQPLVRLLAPALRLLPHHRGVRERQPVQPDVDGRQPGYRPHGLPKLLIRTDKLPKKTEKREGH